MSLNDEDLQTWDDKEQGKKLYERHLGHHLQWLEPSNKDIRKNNCIMCSKVIRIDWLSINNIKWQWIYINLTVIVLNDNKFNVLTMSCIIYYF